jgi:hypothetical protein
MKVQARILVRLDGSERVDLGPGVEMKRTQLMRAAMLTGISSAALFGTDSKRPGLRPLLEPAMGIQLGYAGEMRKFIPAIAALEREQVNKDIHNKLFTLIFDGTPRFGDVLAFIARYFVDDPVLGSRVHERLFSVIFAEKTPKANQLGGLIASALKTGGLEWKDMIGVTCDAAPTNVCALKNLKRTKQLRFPVITCFAHFGSNAGGKVHFVILDAFWHLLQGVFGHSDAAKNAWKEITGKSFPSHSPTRWHSKFEQLGTVRRELDKLPKLLTQLVINNVSPACEFGWCCVGWGGLYFFFIL